MQKELEEKWDPLNMIFDRGLSVFPILKAIGKPAISNWQTNSAYSLTEFRDGFRCNGKALYFDKYHHELAINITSDLFVFNVYSLKSRKDHIQPLEMLFKLHKKFDVCNTLIAKTRNKGFQIYFRATIESQEFLKNIDKEKIYKEFNNQVDVKTSVSYCPCPLNVGYEILNRCKIEVVDAKCFFKNYEKDTYSENKEEEFEETQFIGRKVKELQRNYGIDEDWWKPLCREFGLSLGQHKVFGVKDFEKDLIDTAVEAIGCLDLEDNKKEKLISSYKLGLTPKYRRF